jgi:hypothetical protein
LKARNFGCFEASEVRGAVEVRRRKPAGRASRPEEPVEGAMIKKKGVPGDDDFGVIPDDEADDYEDGEDEFLEGDDDLEDDEFEDEDEGEEFDEDFEDDDEEFGEEDDVDFDEFEDDDSEDES